MSTPTRSSRRACAILVATLAITSAARAQDAIEPPDPLGALRAQVRDGLEEYKAGHYEVAIVKWEAVLANPSVGIDTGYRLVFNIARAYDALPNRARAAADRYELYIDEVEKRRAEGKTLEPNVEKQAEEAKERLDFLRQKLGRIVVTVLPGTIAKLDKEDARVGPFAIHIDPGPHVLVLTTSYAEETKRLDVKPGTVETIDWRPPPPPPPSKSFVTTTEHPFSKNVLYIAGGVTVAASVVSIIALANANSYLDDFDALHVSRTSDPTQTAREETAKADYDDAKSTFHTTLIFPIACAAITGGLIAWYFVGTKEHVVEIQPNAAITAGGASLGFSGRF